MLFCGQDIQSRPLQTKLGPLAGELTIKTDDLQMTDSFCWPLRMGAEKTSHLLDQELLTMYQEMSYSVYWMVLCQLRQARSIREGATGEEMPAWDPAVRAFP